MKKILGFLFFTILLFSVSGLIVFIGIKNERGLFYFLGQELGVIAKTDLVSGTGSMFPTFPKGEGKTDLERSREIVARHKTRKYPGGILLFGKRYFGYQLQKGDIVFFSNQKTKEIIAKESSGSANLDAGFVKRIIALPNDKIEIRDGFLKINNAFQKEPYIAKPRSTYGGSFLHDCQIITIGQNKLFVMGDNRKGSNDSRSELGLIDVKDIHTVIPINQQEDLKANWRNTDNDFQTANQPIFDNGEFVSLLNQKRAGFQTKGLKLNHQLNRSAKIRADTILEFNDLSFEATKSGQTMKKAMDKVGYFNTTWGEVPAIGYYEAEELVENYFQFPDSKNFLLNADFEELGVASSIGEINGCPIQTVVVHLAGYIPPNYSQETIKSWGGLYENTKTAYESWKKAKQFPNVDQSKLDKLLNLLSARQNYAYNIWQKMSKNIWLNKDDENAINDDNAVYGEITRLINELNEN